ncbi:MAG: DUF5110 domain-containing protein [Ignavibacteria bacterium]|nr:DUF5110 domain-containing protein [Ignavibacteria bacterium]
MFRKYLSILAFVFSLAIVIEAQSFKKTELGIKSTINSVDYEIQFINPSIVRILKSPVQKEFSKESFSVIAKPANTEINITENGNSLSVSSKELTVKIDLKNGAVSFFKLSGELLLSEKNEGYSFTKFDDIGNSTFSVGQSFNLSKDEAIYGLGQQQQGKMIQRNIKLKMVQGNTDDYSPFFVSIKGYGLFWDNYSPTTFTDNPGETTFSSEVGDCIDYYFMYGENLDGVIAKMRELTGQAPMFPLWTFGYWQSKERYKSQDELVDVVKKYRELNVPIDGIIQDWQYWGNNYLWNAMEFLNVDFPNPKKMIDDVHKLNARMIISIWNSFGPQTKQYKELDKIGALMDFNTWPQSGSEKWPPNMDYPSGVKVYDPYNPNARDIYWRHLNKGIFELGMDGWWMDSSEPDHLDAKDSDLNNKTYLGSFRKVRNAFPLMTVGGVYQNQRKVSSDKRVFILTRSAFAGQQRYGANTWSGDVVASWDALRNQISAGLNFSLTGIPYWNSDIGGFFLWNFPKKLEDPNYRELYVRWIQFGAFCPMMRSHGADAPREIYQFGKRGDILFDAIEKSIKLRYSLLPYIYSSAWEVTSKHSTMMRALAFDFANDKNALDINNEYLFGKNLLVCPVTNPMYSKSLVNGKDTVKIADFSQTKSSDIYLPKGSNWVDFWTGEKLNGGQTIKKETPIDIIPLYLKAGSILPIGPDVQYAAEKNWQNLEIRIYPGADGEFTLYEDENDNYNYEKGIYSTISFVWDDASKTLTVNDREGSFPGMLEERTFNIVLVSKDNGLGFIKSEKCNRIISYNGKQLKIPLK